MPLECAWNFSRWAAIGVCFTSLNPYGRKLCTDWEGSFGDSLYLWEIWRLHLWPWFCSYTNRTQAPRVYLPVRTVSSTKASPANAISWVFRQSRIASKRSFSSSFAFLNSSLHVLTAFSAFPFDCGYRGLDVLELPFSGELRKCFVGKCWAIVSDNYLGDPVTDKMHLELLNHSQCFPRVNLRDFQVVERASHECSALPEPFIPIFADDVIAVTLI